MNVLITQDKLVCNNYIISISLNIDSWLEFVTGIWTTHFDAQITCNYFCAESKQL